MIGKSKAQQKLIDNLAAEFGKVWIYLYVHFAYLLVLDNTYIVYEWLTNLKQVQREFHLPPGDFPNVEYFRERLSGYNIDKFEKLKPKMIQAVDDMLAYDIPNLLKNFRNPYD